MFEKMDLDRSGTLDYWEVQKLVKRCKKQLLLLPPEYSVDDDWAEMTVGAEPGSAGAEAVTFSAFERWWKDRMGLVEADAPAPGVLLAQAIAAGVNAFIYLETGRFCNRKSRFLP